MPLDAFNSLFEGDEIESVLRNALLAQQEERERSRARTSQGRQQAQETKPRVDYATLEHAGEPHRGTISEAEKAIVRDNLEEVNRRLEEKGMRLIDPNDPEMAQRYRLNA